jgi:hypothetical protein
MWTHSDVAVLLKAVQTAYLLQQEEFAEPQPGIEAMLDRWDKAVEDFIVEPGSERMGPLRVSMRELVESSGDGGLEWGNGRPDYVQRDS